MAQLSVKREKLPSVLNSNQTMNENRLVQMMHEHESKHKITLSEFSAQYRPKWSLDTSPEDPTKAKYWDMFAADPNLVNQQKEQMRNKARAEHGDAYMNRILFSDRHHVLRSERSSDFRLNEKELETLKTHGMVVSERLGHKSFGDAYYRLYSDDLPVFITADSVMHAWHQSFDAILKYIEGEILVPTLQRILGFLQQKLPVITCEKTRADVDYYIAVALCLLSGERGLYTIAENKDRTIATLDAIEQQKTMGVVLFGKPRTEDFSQFKPRGHYESQEVLRRYFKAMMWLGRIDFRLNGRESNMQQIRCAVMLVLLLRSSEECMASWKKFEKTLQLFIGEADCMTPLQLHDILNVIPELQGKEDVWSIDDQTMLRIQLQIEELDVGNQLINSALREPEAVERLPKSFAMFGQRFTVDAFALSQVVAPDESQAIHKQRRVPSSLDVAFSVLQNNNTVPEISRRTSVQDGVPFRDGLPYVHALDTTRRAMDQLDDANWSQSLYSMWLDCLRELSKAPSHESPTFHSEAWAMRMLNTQLASYTELKHDTILYTKQSYTCDNDCEYADVFVEPVPRFWTKLRCMAERAASLLMELYGTGTPKEKHEIYSRYQQAFFRRFAKVVGKLEDASKKLVKDQPLVKKEWEFLKNVVEIENGSGSPQYLGWYPSLFYLENENSCKWDPLVADIHTDPSDRNVGDPGCIVHTAVGNVFMGLFMVNQRRSDKDDTKSRIFAGPVFSFYEFQQPIDQRMTDSEWRNLMRNRNGTRQVMPDPPEWATSTYLVPSENPMAQHFWHEDDNM